MVRLASGVRTLPAPTGEGGVGVDRPDFRRIPSRIEQGRIPPIGVVAAVGCSRAGQQALASPRAPGHASFGAMSGCQVCDFVERWRRADNRTGRQ